MKAIWQTNPRETWPAWENIRRAGCNRIYFPAMAPVFEGDRLVRFDPNTRQIANDYREAVVSQSFQYAIFRDAHWEPKTSDPLELARAAHQDIVTATGGNKFRACAYMFDIEFPFRDEAFLLDCFREFRRLRPTRLLSWTMEPMQGGWIRHCPNLVRFVNRDPNMVVVPQTFHGNMDPVPIDLVLADMKATGIDPRRIRLCLDAAKARPAVWDGFLFHAERLVLFA